MPRKAKRTAKKKTPAPKKRTAKKRSRNKAPPAEAIERVILLMASGQTEANIRASQAAGKLKIPTNQLDAAIAEARVQITLAADFNRDEEIGRALTRLRDCYKQARALVDIRTALSCAREINKLLRLYTPPTRGAPPTEDESAAEDVLREHLERLGLAEEKDTTEEIARKTVAEIVRLRAELYRQEGRRR